MEFANKEYLLLLLLLIPYIIWYFLYRKKSEPHNENEQYVHLSAHSEKLEGAFSASANAFYAAWFTL